MSELCADSPFSLAAQLSSLPAPAAPVRRFNPRPAGVIREGSTSEAILAYLREVPGFKTEAQIIWKTRRSHSAVSVALLYLIRQGLIESRPDPTRSTRYKRYRAIRGCDENRGQ